MKKTRKLMLSIGATMMLGSTTYAQEILEKLSQDHVHFQQTVTEAETYFNRVGKGKGSGYKLYQRWKARAEARVMEDGYVLSSNTLAQVLNNKERNKLSDKSANSNWKSLGPLAWTNGGGYNPGVGRVTAIAVEPNNQQIIYIGSPGGGLWKSGNGGSSWQAKGDNFDNMDVWGVSIDPSNPNTVFYGNGIGELYKSTDGAENFTKVLDVNSGKIQTILFHPTNSNIIHAAVKTSSSSARGIYKSTDGGSNWTRVLSVLIEDIFYQPGSTSVLYACGNDFYRSTDSGDNYTQISSGIQSSQRMKLAVTPANSNYVYILQRNGSEFGWLYRSTDGGSSFTVQEEHTTSPNYIGSQANRDLAIAVSTTNANEVHIGGLDMYVSTNGGDTFTQECDWYYPSTTPGGSGSGHSYVHADIEVLQYIDGIMYAGTDGGIYKSTDAGDNFTNLSVGLGISQFYRISNSKTDKYRVAAGAQDNGMNVKSGANHSWVHMMGADGMEVAIDPGNSNVIYGMIQYGKLYKSTNGGASRYFAAQPPESGSGNWITPMALDPNNGSIVYAGYNDLYRNSGGAESGTTWDNLSTGISFSGKLSHIETCPTDANKIYVARSNRIWVSSDLNLATPTWTLVNTGVSGTINSIAVDPTDDERVVICTSSGNVYESTNSGTSWTNIKAGLPSVSVISVALNGYSNQGIYAAIDGAVYYRDNSTSWTLYSNKLPKMDIDEIELFFSSPGESRVRIATYGRGLWEAPFFDEGNGLSCASTVSSYPYTQGFESASHDWTQVLDGDDFDWTRKTGATGSTNTGPSAAAEGSYYMYTESSSPNYPSKNAKLLSPCFDLSGLNSPEISFQYHMYGASMGTLQLEASNDGLNWTTLWSTSGDQGDVWNSTTVSLWAYASHTIQLRFSGTTTTSWTSDFSIDDVSVEDGSACATLVTSFPYAESFESGLGNWSHDATDDFDWVRRTGSTPSTATGPTSANDGSYYMHVESSSPNYPTKNGRLVSPCFSLNNLINPEFNFNYHMYGASMGTLKLQLSSNGGANWSDLWSASGDKGDVWLSASVDLSAYLGSVIQLRFDGTTTDSWTSDMSVDNLEIISGIACGSVASLPVSEGFDTDFGIWNQETGDDMDWTRRTGSTTSLNTGPAGAAEGTHYIYMESSSPNYPSKQAQLTSNCIELNNDPVANFSYHMYGASMGTLRLQVSTNGSSWTTLWSKSGDQGDAWYAEEVDLSAYANTTVQLRLWGTTGSSFTSDICVDGFEVSVDPPEATTAEEEPTQGIVAEALKKEAEATQEGLLLFPNPAQDKINVQYVGTEGNVQLMMYNLNGQLLRNETHPSSSGVNLIKLNVDNLPNGIYYLRMQSAGKIYSEKIEVIH